MDGNNEIHDGQQRTAEPLLDVREVARYLRCSVTHVKRLCERDVTFPSYDIGTSEHRELRFVRGELDEWMRARRAKRAKRVAEPPTELPSFLATKRAKRAR